MNAYDSGRPPTQASGQTSGNGPKLAALGGVEEFREEFRENAVAAAIAAAAAGGNRKDRRGGHRNRKGDLS